MLYDLQKVCVDHERGIYTLDVVGWATSLGRKPIKRFLPGQRDVLISKHLRGAARRLPSARLVEPRSQPPGRFVASRPCIGPKPTCGRASSRSIDRALDEVKLLPQNPPERVARKKLVDEILDRIVERGFLSMGDLRDALSRNNLKLPDLASVGQFLSGRSTACRPTSNWPTVSTACIAAARSTCDGRSGSARWRSARRVGRFLTRYVALPFGGAYIALEGSATSF